MINIEKLHRTIFNKHCCFIDRFLISCYNIVGCIQLNITKLILVEINDMKMFELLLPRLEKIFLDNEIKIEYVRKDSALVSSGKQRIKTLVRFIDNNTKFSKNKGSHIIINMEI